jgi:DNA-binding NarL/FixJ family response regulator
MKHARKRILIVDDHPVVREALAIRISRSNDLEVCGEAADVAEALQLVDETGPDVAIIDIALKTGDGVELIKQIKSRDERVRMLVWSMYGEHLYAERALRAGAMGYITKEQATDRIIDAIHQVLQGRLYVSDGLREKLLQRTVGQTVKPMEQAPTDALTDRELAVFRLIGQGVTTSAIARRLHLSVHTIETYRERIKTKLGFNSGAELAREAVQWLLENGRAT